MGKKLSSGRTFPGEVPKMDSFRQAGRHSLAPTHKADTVCDIDDRRFGKPVSRTSQGSLFFVEQELAKYCQT